MRHLWEDLCGLVRDLGPNCARWRAACRADSVSVVTARSGDAVIVVCQGHPRQPACTCVVLAGGRSECSTPGTVTRILFCVRGRSGRTPDHRERAVVKAEFTAIIEAAPEGGYWAMCPEISGANGQGETVEQAKESLKAAIELILTDRREDMLRGLPTDAIQATVSVE